MAHRPVLASALTPGATIAFVSLSARVNDVFPGAISRASAVLSSHGFHVRVFFEQPDSGIQSSIANRLSELRSAFSDPSVSAVVCTIGGGSFTELLPDLMADGDLHRAIRASPKIVVGCSDMTGLHWFLHAFTGLRTFYGPSAIPELGTADAPGDGASPLAFCVKNLLDMVSTPEPLGHVARSPVYAPKLPDFFRDGVSTQAQSVVPSPRWKWLRPGKAQGRLFGGCLSVVVRLNGIRFLAPDWRGRIIFLETSVGDADDLDQVRTGIADLIAQGVFEEAAGLIVGRPYGYDSEEARGEFEGVIRGLLCEGRLAEAENRFPILLNVDIGHTTPMVTLPFDALAAMDSERDEFMVLEPGVMRGGRV